MIDKLVDLREEWENLSPKIDKIGSFVNSEEFNDLPPKDKAICEWTYKVMRDYHKTLREIITISNDEGVSVPAIKEGRFGMRKRKKPSQSWMERSKYEIENEDSLLAERQKQLKEIREMKTKEKQL